MLRRIAIAFLFSLLPASVLSSEVPECLRYSGLVVLYPTAHGQPASDTRSTLRDQLTALGATFIETSDPLHTPLLQTAGAVWFTSQTAVFSGVEHAALRDWLAAGGRALFEGGGATSFIAWQGLLNAAFVSAGFPVGTSPPAGTTSNVYAHPVTSGVTSVDFPHPDGEYNPNAATAVVDDATASHTVAAAFEDVGRFVFVTDQLFHDAFVGAEQNLKFGKKIFDWFTEGLPVGDRTASVTPAGINLQLETGQSTVVNLDIDNIGTCDLEIIEYALQGAITFPAPPVFADDFEDGDLVGWTDAGGTGAKSVESAAAANGTSLGYREEDSPVWSLRTASTESSVTPTSSTCLTGCGPPTQHCRTATSC